MTLLFLPLYPKSLASADRICFSIVNSFIPSLPELATVPHPQHPQDPQLPTASSGLQPGTQALFNNAGEPPLRWDEQMGLTEVVGFSQRLPLASTASLWALLVIQSMEDLWMQTSKNKLCWCYSTAVWAW